MAFPMSSPSLVDAMCSPNGKGGDLSMSCDDAPVKVRKPYTITKQRERWTEEEHQKFLDALKLHGRAWRRIEEHIGSKTAVQIRSHAQKFFSKVEREASLNGSLTTIGSGEIEIPPPRPKRKPSHPYPKKASCTFSGSPSFEEDCKSPPAVHSAFTPLENSAGMRASKVSSEKHGSSAASLRLFGQTFTPATDKVEGDTDLMESTGSPRSQISFETEETTGISRHVSNAASGVWDRHGSVAKPHELAGTQSGTNSQLCKAIAEWEKSYIAIHTPTFNNSDVNNAAHMTSAYGCRPDAGCFMPYPIEGHPLAQFSVGMPTFWQGLVPPGFAHNMSEDMNTAAAIAAATYAVASAWQAIHGAFANNASKEGKANIVYNPIAMPAAAREQAIPISRPAAPVAHMPKQTKWKQGGSSSGSGNEDEGNSLHGEESTAECCSSLTETSRLSSHESNDEGIPAKRCRRTCNDDSMHLDKEPQVSPSVSTYERLSTMGKPLSSNEGLDISGKDNSAVPSAHSRSTGDHLDGAHGNARLASSSNRSLQPENDAATISVHISMDTAQSIDLTTQACGLDLPSENGKESGSPRAPKDGNDSHKGMLASSTSSQSTENGDGKSMPSLNGSHRSQTEINNLCLESEHFSVINTGEALWARYSGVGFVPYKKTMKAGSLSKHEGLIRHQQ